MITNLFRIMSGMEKSMIYIFFKSQLFHRCSCKFCKCMYVSTIKIRSASYQISSKSVQLINASDGDRT